MPVTPPDSLVALLHRELQLLLQDNPVATSSEAYVQNHVEFALLREPVSPPYYLRIGINYHGQQVQHVQVSEKTSELIGWNPDGDPLGTGRRAKFLLGKHTIFPRRPDEHNMTDSKIGGGPVPAGLEIRIEFKVRGWLGKTRNLDGAQLEKDIDLLQDDRADLLVIALSEIAHLKWRGEGPVYQAERRTGTARFRQILLPGRDLPLGEIVRREMSFEGAPWVTSAQRVAGSASSLMPGAEHVVTLCWQKSSE